MLPEEDAVVALPVPVEAGEDQKVHAEWAASARDKSLMCCCNDTHCFAGLNTCALGA